MEIEYNECIRNTLIDLDFGGKSTDERVELLTETTVYAVHETLEVKEEKKKNITSARNVGT